jgi:porphobilinogen synthase
MILAAVSAGLIVREKAIYESLISIKRAGADIILSYFAKELFSM